MNDSRPQLRRIGAGFCGTVWAVSDTGSAFKREDGGPDRSLRHDFETHQHILQCMRQTALQYPKDATSTAADKKYHINIPLCHGFITPTDTWWTGNLDRFPPDYKPCNMTEMQRIPPVSEATRELLIERYCPAEMKSAILRSDTNRDCLIRPYLGRRRIQRTSSPTRPSKCFFSLRNYPLHIDQMEGIGISEEDIMGYSRTMADTLAFLHWVARIDGNDVEFVLAAPNDITNRNFGTKGTWNNALGLHEMWILDFDLARPMTMDEHGVRQAANAFWKNDPFYPRPDQHSAIWKAFHEQYLSTSKEHISGTGPDDGLRESLPGQFIRLVEKSPRGVLPTTA
ncbi:zinc finger protein-domain-containing protein [Aspergillus carlsbadensis]|nr:zinc finger protein-domain-containing protein [Aspergillus carlsbadensis]